MKATGTGSVGKAPLRSLTIAAAALLVLAAGCGGGGGGGGPIIVDESLLPLYRFLFQSQQDGIVASLEESLLQLDTVGTTHVGGTLDTVTGEATLSANSRIDVTDLVQNLFGDLTVRVTIALVVPEDADPTSGAFEVLRGTDRVVVTVQAAPAGVTVGYDAGNNGTIDNTVDLSWDQLFEIDFADMATPEYQKMASFGAGLLGIVVDQLELTFQTIVTIRDSETQLAATGALLFPCDPVSAPLTPVGFAEEGTVELGWFDDDQDSAIGAGDSFVLNFLDCWTDDPGNAVDMLEIGTLRFLDYTEEVNADSEVTRIGFEGPSGGVFLEAYLTAETVTDAGTNEVTAGIGVVLSGTATIVFFE